jgi:hypothetical protein
MIASVGLLTPEGLDYFHAIFEDYENMGDKKRDLNEFLFQGIAPFAPEFEAGKPHQLWEQGRKDNYKTWLKSVRPSFVPDYFLRGLILM